MDTFLQLSRQSLNKLSTLNTIHLVVGNESCDLDSAVSSLVLAFIHFKSKYESKDGCISIPILNVTRKQLKLRSEIVFWFEEALKLDLKVIFCKDEFNWSSLKKEGKNVLISLVDHNENAEFESLGQVVQIIDHHTCKRTRDEVADFEVDTSVGSCSTLIADRYLKSCPDEESFDVQVILMLYGPVVLDTICLSPEAKRFNELDLQIIERLEEIMSADSGTRNEVYKQLIESKNMIPSNLEDLFNKDLKIVKSGTKSVALPSISGFLAQDVLNKHTNELDDNPIRSQLEVFRATNGLEGIIVLGIKNQDPNHVQRDLLLYFPDEEFLGQVCTKLEAESSGLSLQVVKKKASLVIYNQLNVTASRKVILPLISQLVSQNSSNPEPKVGHSTPNVTQEQDEKQQHELMRKKKDADDDEDRISAERKKKEREIDTRDVDPDFAVNYKLETVDFPDSPEKQTQPETMVIRSAGESNSCKGEQGVNSSGTNISTIVVRESSEPIVKNQKMTLNIDASSKPQLTSQSICGSNLSPSKLVSTPKTPQMQSMNYYESYFDDSYIGEFTGEVPADATLSEDESSSPVNQEWQNVITSDTGGVIEFAYDSFGPESIVFQANDDPKAEPEESKDDSQDSKVASNVSKVASNVSKVTSSEVAKDESPPNEADESLPPKLSPTGEETPNSESDGQDSLASGGSSSAPVGNFKRNSSLTVSQRKKVSPQINLSDIMNASDEVTPSVISIQETPSTINDNNLIYVNQYISTNELDPSKLLSEGTPSRPTTLPRKKISVDRNYIENAENQKTPEGDSDRHPLGMIPDYDHKQEVEDSRRWMRSCPIGNCDSKPIDLKVIEPYKKVISHAGYYHHFNSVQLARNPEDLNSGSGPAIITFAACYLPDRSRRDYHYVMDHLFMYVLTTLHDLVADDYILVYFHNSSKSANNMPTFSWLKRCYYMIDIKLRKNLKHLYLVHPTFWLKTLVIMTKPLLSSKFSRKLKFVNNLNDLNELVPLERTLIPPEVLQCDEYFATS